MKQSDPEKLNYTQYPADTRILVKSTGEHGEAYESAANTISVFIDGEKRCRYFDLDDVIILKQEGK
jgi:archaellum component FlaG (FlaF/FlaG flagellin family)